jgi:prophage regulatory protein
MEIIMEQAQETWTERRAESRNPEIRLIRLKLVMARCGTSRSTIYEGMKSGTFPKAVKLGVRSTAWIEGEIEDWLYQRIRASRGK